MAIEIRRQITSSNTNNHSNNHNPNMMIAFANAEKIKTLGAQVRHWHRA